MRWGAAQYTHTQLEENTQGFNCREREKWSLQIIREKENFVQEGRKQAKPTFLRSFYEREKKRGKKQNSMKFKQTGRTLKVAVLIRDERVRMRRGSSARVDFGVIVDRVGG